MDYTKKNTIFIGWNEITEKFLKYRIDNPKEQLIVDFENNYERDSNLFYENFDYLNDVNRNIDFIFYFFEKFDLNQFIRLSKLCEDIDACFYICSNVKGLKDKRFLDLRGFERIFQRRYFIKEFFSKTIDLMLSIIVLIFLSPIFIFISLLIYFKDGFPIFFVQERVGINGKLFKMVKFRTMFSSVGRFEASPLESNDSRVTNLGRFLRKTSLDELPQFFNVLKGDMSIIGPRPEMEFIVKQYNDFEYLRLRVKPGITGAWQVGPTRNSPIHFNVDFDIYQMIHNSFFYKLKIIYQTIFIANKGF